MIQFILWVHVTAGFVALALGPVAMSVRKQRGTHTRVGEIYHWLVLLVCLLAVTLVAFDFDRLWLFLPIAAGSYSFALLGYVAAKVRWHDWLSWHIIGQGGSYIAMVTAFLVANWHNLSRVTEVPPSPMIAWFAPTIIGTPIIIWATTRISRKRPTVGPRK